MINKFNIIFNTVKYLKIKQIVFRLFYIVYKPKFKLTKRFNKPSRLDVYVKHDQKGHIRSNKNDYFVKFLNKEKIFKENIDWNYKGFGKLWTYNLNYFDFLFDETLNEEYNLKLIYNFIDNFISSVDGKEPYTISLRGINWVKYFTLQNLKDERLINHLYSQYKLLSKKIEYHLMGNHLLENGFSLLFGAYYFNDKNFFNKAKKILISELNEQILSDGCHFERSPMYHLILLERLLESVFLIANNDIFIDTAFKEFLSNKARMMLSWINNMTFSNYEIPLFNDSVKGHYPKPNDINPLAKKLKLESLNLMLGESGYRKINHSNYEACVDVGNIGPDYQPGHAHSDTFSFELYFKGKPLIVEVGTSTYDIGEVRSYERSTQAHNTVKYENHNQSEVWGGFRVARRAKVINLEEKKNYISATHDGYKNYGVLHQRIFKFKPKVICIEDFLNGKIEKISKAYLHFHPDIDIEIKEGKKVYIKGVEIDFNGHEDISLTEYKYADDFNSRKLAKCIEITFRESLKTLIKIEE